MLHSPLYIQVRNLPNCATHQKKLFTLVKPNTLAEILHGSFLKNEAKLILAGFHLAVWRMEAK